MSRIRATLPLQPDLARVFGVQIVLDLETHIARKILGAFADDQMMVRVIHHGPGNERRSADSFNGAYRACPFFWSMHTGRVELYDTFSVWQAAVANTVIQWIELHNIDARDNCVEHVLPLRDHREGFMDRGHVTAVFEAVTVRGRDHQGLDGALCEYCGK